MLEEVVPGELHQALQCRARRQVLEPQAALGVADMGIAVLERRQEQAVLVAEVVIQHALVRAGALGDAVHARAPQAVARELVQRRVEDALARAVGVAVVPHSMPSRR